MSYGTSIAETMRESGVDVGKLLRGARVSDLPVLLPTRYELVINVKTAKALVRPNDATDFAGLGR